MPNNLYLIHWAVGSFILKIEKNINIIRIFYILNVTNISNISRKLNGRSKIINKH